MGGTYDIVLYHTERWVVHTTLCYITLRDGWYIRHCAISHWAMVVHTTLCHITLSDGWYIRHCAISHWAMGGTYDIVLYHTKGWVVHTTLCHITLSDGWYIRHCAISHWAMGGTYDIVPYNTSIGHYKDREPLKLWIFLHRSCRPESIFNFKSS